MPLIDAAHIIDDLFIEAFEAIEALYEWLTYALCSDHQLQEATIAEGRRTS